MMLWIVSNYLIGMLPAGGKVVEVNEVSCERRGMSSVVMKYKPDKKKEFTQQVEVTVNMQSNEKYVAKRLLAALKEQEIPQ